MSTQAALPARHAFFATCPRNTESLLRDELTALGAADVVETRGGVSFSGPLEVGLRACLWSRVASRILLNLTRFPVAEVDELYEGIFHFPWEDHLVPTRTLAVSVTCTVAQGPLARVNTHFAEQRVKDAVVDRLRALKGARPSIDLLRPDVRLGVHLRPAGRDKHPPQGVEAWVSVDLSGESLHRRGYRVAGGEAPLKENLAAAILLRVGWPAIAREGGPLVDPMCGSGTLLIEAALLAAGAAPGLGREYWGFQGWAGFEPSLWQDVVQEAAERRAEGLGRVPLLIGYDSDGQVLRSARANREVAGLAEHIMLERRAVADLTRPQGGRARNGLVVTNPPYGKRLGDADDLVPLYEALGSRLKEHFAGWEAAVFTANPELSPHLGLRAYRVNTLYNGPLECKLLLFKIGPGFSLRAGEGEPVKTQASSREAGAAMFADRLRKNLRHLSRWAKREGVSCFRVYDADLPEYAVAVDLYEDWAHVQEYAAPPGVDPVKARRRLRQVMEVVPDVLGIPSGHVVLKVRSRQRGENQYQKLADQGRMLEVGEGGLRFLVNLTDYLDTGLFLDHRPTRELIRRSAAGRRFLNLFAYTGTATVYAAAGGAVSTTTVDLSSTYLEWARRNLALNGFTGPEHGFVRADCLEWLEAVAEGGAPEHPPSERGAGRLAYDLIFLDPPTFSNSKSMTGTLDVQRDHPRLLRAAMRLLAPGGILLFSTNFRRFRLDPALAQQFQVLDLTRQTIPPDFTRNPRIHKCYRLTAADGWQKPQERARL
jgi:23S rRNA (guanine2445-N2)-methyltransferase / 23S rRNA (guanine2069-N7)-methyltransferase